MSFIGVISLIGILLAAEPEKNASPPVGEKQEKAAADKRAKSKQPADKPVGSGSNVVAVDGPASREKQGYSPDETGYWPKIISDSIALFAALVALGIGIVTVGRINRQLAVAGEQTEEMRKSAKAATDNVIATKELANLERPWFMFAPRDPVNAAGDSAWPLRDRYTLDAEVFRVPYDIVNIGRSPGFLTGMRTVIEIINADVIPDKPSVGEPFNLILSSKNPPEDRYGDSKLAWMDKPLFDKVSRGEMAIWVYGIVRYLDTNRVEHSTRFCCRWMVVDGEVFRFDPIGPEGWTEYT